MLVRRLALAVAAVALTAPAVAGVSFAPAASAATGANAIPTTAPCGALPASSAPATFSHVALIIFENKPVTKIVGDTTDAPYLNSLIKACSYSKNDLSLSNTSLANYIALTSGYVGCSAADANGSCTTQKEITSNMPPATWPQASKSLFEVMGSNAAEWAESSPGNCPLTEQSSLFAINHAPYQYYTRTQHTICPQYDQPFPSDVTTMLSAQFNLITPNKFDIMHKWANDSTNQLIQNGDNWAKSAIPQLLASPSYQSGNTAIVITWDEGNANQALVPLIVLTPYTTVGGVSSVAYSHYSVLKGLQQMVGYASPLLGHAADPGLNSIRDDSLFGLKGSGTTQTVPSAPVGVQGVAGDGSASLTWSPPASDGGAPVTGYTVYRDSGAGPVVVGTPTGTSFTDSGLTNGTTYSYTVSATNSLGQGPVSAPPVAVTPVAASSVPGAPGGFTVTAGSGGNTLSWSAPDQGSSPITGYNVYRGTTSGGETLYASGVTSTSYLDSAATAGTAYFYQVSAVNAVGEGGRSVEQSTGTPPPPTVPAAPTLTGTANPGSNDLTWTVPADGGSPITSYSVIRNNVFLKTVTSPSYSDTAIRTGTKYTYTVRAQNSVGKSPSSNKFLLTAR